MFKKIKAGAGFLILFGAMNTARADFVPVDGYIGAGYNFLSHLSDSESGSRSRLSLEFGRISKSVALDLLYGTGLGYTDAGVSLRFFRPFAIPNEDSLFRIHLGANVTGTYASVGLNSTLADGSQSVRKFGDLGVGFPDIRFIFDFGMGLALSLNLGTEFVITRSYVSGLPGKDSTTRTRFMGGISLLTSSRWLE